MIHDTQSAQISKMQDERNIYEIMKTMCPPSYHHNGFVASHALGHMMHGYTLLVPMNLTLYYDHIYCGYLDYARFRLSLSLLTNYSY